MHNLAIAKGQIEKLLATNVMLLSIINGAITTRMAALACLRRNGFPLAQASDIDDAFAGVRAPWDGDDPEIGLTHVGRVISVGQGSVELEVDDPGRLTPHQRIDLTPIVDLDRRDCLTAEAVLEVLGGVAGFTEWRGSLDDSTRQQSLDDIADAVRSVRQGLRG